MSWRVEGSVDITAVPG